MHHTPAPDSNQSELIIEQVALVVERPMAVPTDVVYSTNPKVGVDASARRYYIKGGDDVGIVLGELIGHVLAGYYGIPVPHYVSGTFSANGTVWFGSSIVEDAVRDVEPYLKLGRVAVPLMLARVILLDVWLANYDRNIGNLLGRPMTSAGKGFVELVAIDFEKSLTVRSAAPLIEIPQLAPGKFWPTGVLGQLCKGRFQFPKPLIVELQRISVAQIRSAVETSFAAARVADAARVETITDVLVKRQQNLETLARLEWN